MRTKFGRISPFVMASTLQISLPVKRRKYDEAFKAEALRLEQENRSTRAVAQQLSISQTLLYRWQQVRDQTEAGSTAQAPDQGWRAEHRWLQRELAVEKKLWHLQPRDSVSPYRFIEQHRRQVLVRHLCALPQVSASAYYASRGRRAQPTPA